MIIWLCMCFIAFYFLYFLMVWLNNFFNFVFQKWLGQISWFGQAQLRTGSLTFKEAYHYFNPVGQLVPWAKLIWRNCIPPSNSFLSWRIVHNKLPSDENLWARGCIVVSMCSLSKSAWETTNHLFLDCPFAHHIWHWFGCILNSSIDRSNFYSILSACDRGWCTQIKDMVVAGILNILWQMWQWRNKARFENVCIPVHSAISLIISKVSLTGNASKGYMSSSISEFVILKSFMVAGHPIKTPCIRQVDWHTPPCGMIKYNTDGAAKGSPGAAACGGLFRDNNAAILEYCFSSNLGIQNAFYAELSGEILAIEIAFNRGWMNLWLECDFKLVLLAFSNVSIVPWRLKNRW